MSNPLFFGYGSLVNTATHSYPNARNATLAGYRRVWRHTTNRSLAYLSVEPHPGSHIQGIVAEVPNGDWAALDLREESYARSDVTRQTAHDGPAGPVAVYAVTDWHPDEAHSILLSYIDVVVQGFLRRFGPSGAQAFFDSTAGWATPIQNDRADPIYPRAQLLTPEETAFTDAALERVRAKA